MIEITDTYTACGIVEGFDRPDDATAFDDLNAWAYLIKTGAAWSLQGWYGRNASHLIDNGYITKDGTVTIEGARLARDGGEE